MSAIFISHSSKDNAVATEFKAQLAEQGHCSVFLDFDPEDGIPAGRNWERELYARLRSCQAVIVLCSEHSVASRWCFAEITQAKSLGKHLFPLKVAICQIPSLLSEFQVIDLTLDPVEGYQRLWSGLKKAGLDPSDVFDWDGSRPPYPGLLAFQEKDAAVYFGRDANIREVLETLNRLQRHGELQLVLILGASGSGKSSLVRAGVVPRLKRDKDHWLVLDPFRPLGQPFEELAMVLASAFDRFEKPRDWKSICEALNPTADHTDNACLLEMANDLRVAAGQREATILLIIDQFEELLGRDDDTASRFLHLVGALLDARSNPFLILGTLRSDFLGVFQVNPAVQNLPYEPIPLAQMAFENFPQVIEGPARVADIELGEDLVQAMVMDTATNDALPLLAFTLRELWELYRKDHPQEARFTLGHYRDQLGGLKGSVARAAEKVCERISAEQERQLHRAFLAMVRVDEEGHYIGESHYIRKPAPWAELPEDVHDLLERFVKARLLVSRSEGTDRIRILEVAHEALFRSWERLAKWLKSDREFLLWRQRLRAALAEYVDDKYDKAALLRGVSLTVARGWLKEKADSLDSDEQDFIKKSVAAKKARLRKVIAGVITGFLLITGFAFAAFWQLIETEHQRQEARVGRLVAQAELERNQSPVQLLHSVLLAVEAMNPEEGLGGPSWLPQPALFPVRALGQWLFGEVRLVEANQALRAGLTLLPRPIIEEKLDEKWVNAIAYSLDGVHLATASGNAVREWQVTNGKEIKEFRSLPHDTQVMAIAYSPNGAYIATASGKEVCIWQIASGEKVKCLPHNARVTAVAYSPNGTYLATGSGKDACVWEIASGEKVKCLPHDARVTAVAYSYDGAYLATASGDFAQIWDLSLRKPVMPQLHHEPKVNTLAFSPDGQYLATGGDDRTARLWGVSSGQEVAAMRHGRMTEISAINEKLQALPPGDVLALTFSPDGKYLATASSDNTARVWEILRTVKEVREALRIVHQGMVNALAFSPDSRHLATAGTDGSRIWEISRGGEVARMTHDYAVMKLAFSPDGAYLVTTTSGDSIIRVWQTERSDPEASHITHPGTVRAVAFNPDGKSLVTLGEDNAIRTWQTATGDTEGVHKEYGDGAKFAAISPDGVYVAGVDSDNRVQVWRATSRENVTTLPPHKHKFQSIAFSPDHRYLATASGYTVRIWAMEKREGLAPMKHEFGVARIKQDSSVSDIVFSASGKYLATISSDSIIEVRRAANGEKLIGLPQEGNSVSFSPDEKYLAIANGDTVQVWKITDRQEITRINYEQGQGVNAVAFSPHDGQYLATANMDSTVRVLLWRSKDLIKDACDRIPSDLAKEKWQQVCR